jgi:CSLREA domain-containing protein
LKFFVSLLLAIGCLVALPSVALAETYVVDSTGDQADETPGDEECETSANTCTLRAAIEESNESTGTSDLIHFAGSFNGEGKDTIALSKVLPEIEDQVSIEGGSCKTEAGPQGPCAGIQATSLSYGLSIGEANGVVIEGVAVTGATIGIWGLGSFEELAVRGSWLGMKLDGGNGSGANTGIRLSPGADEAMIGGTAASERNVIVNSAAEGLDIEGASDAVVRGNYFGVGPDGKTKAANGKDIEITDTLTFEALRNEVGATVASGAAPCDGGCNVISGASSFGIDLQGNGAGQNEAPATGPTIVHGNYVGLSADGTETLANGTIGVYAGGADEVTVGGFAAGDPNYIAGGSEGIVSESGGEGFTVLGNRIGLSSNGSEQTPPASKGIFDLSLSVSESAEIRNNVIRMNGGTGIDHRFHGAAITGNTVEGAAVGISTKVGEGGGLIASNEVDTASEVGIFVESPDNDIRNNAVTNSQGPGITVASESGGIALNGNLIGGSSKEAENVIEGSNGAAIEILERAGEPGSTTEIARNRGKSNGGLFIDLVSGANEGILPPTVTTATKSTAEGSAEPGALVRVFRKAAAEAGELAGFLGEAEADGSGNWKVSFGSVPGGTLITATQTNENGGTSELASSLATPAEPSGGGGGNGGGGASGKDTTPPQTKITKGPKAKTHSTTAKFKFSSSEARSTFKCKLDSKPVKSCKSPKTYKKLKPGKHVFKVWAIDSAGNKDPTPAKRKFKVLK